MTDYTKLVEALRCKRDDCEGCDLAFLDKDEGWMCQYAAKDDDAAAAIEELEDALADECSECDYLVNENARLTTENKELQAQLPKRSEWIRHPEVKNIYGGEFIECPFCGEKYVVQYIADEKFCRNCGADMRKMGVQDA